jgi:hypothetical protein
LSRVGVRARVRVGVRVRFRVRVRVRVRVRNRASRKLFKRCKSTRVSQGMTQIVTRY